MSSARRKYAIGDRDFKSKNRVLAHGNPFFVCQLIRFEQNMVRHTHLADVMQERTASYEPILLRLFPPYAQISWSFRSHAGLPLSFLISQVQCMRPSFNGSLVERTEFKLVKVDFFSRWIDSLYKEEEDW